MPERTLQRWGPLAGPIFVVLMVIGFLVAGESPDPDASNAKIASYLAKKSHFDRNVVAFFILLVASLFLLAFFAALRSRLVESEGGVGRLGALALAAGTASTVLLVTAIFVFISPLFAAHDARHHSALDPGIYRVSQDLGYMLWVSSVVIAALAVWATAAGAFRLGLLPRWFGWVSVLIGVVCLFAVFFIPILIFWLWILIAGVLLVLRPVRAAAAPDEPGPVAAR